MYGAYQAGAWRVLEKCGPPGLVVGASVGALNGWAIASGVCGDELAALWLDPSAGRITQHRAPWWPWQSWFDIRSLEERARAMTGSFRPHVEFGVTAVEIPQLRSRLFRNGEVTWKHLVASCAVPAGFPPARLGRRFFIDGGVLCALPIWAAIEMGATRIYAVNALPSVPSRLLRGLTRVVRALAPEVPPQPPPPGSPGVEVIHIVPPGPLGTLHESVTWERDRIARWIARGERDAEAVLAARLAAR